MRLSHLLLFGSIALTSAEAVFAAQYQLVLADGTTAYVEAPLGATKAELAEAYNRQIEAHRLERERRKRELEQERIEIEEKRRQIDKKLAQERRENPDRYREQVEFQIIYRNCIVDKMAGVTEKTAQAFVRQSCLEIANDPSLYQRWKYSD